jgi:hypothetical protein
MKEHEYYSLDCGSSGKIMALANEHTKGNVVIQGDYDHTFVPPDKALDLAFMTLCAAQEADPEHWDERWERFKEQVRKAFGE